MMRFVRFSKDGTAETDKVTKSFDFYEMKDGQYHLAPPDSVFLDRSGKLPPMAFFYDGLITALGSQQTRKLINKFWINMDISKDMGHRPSISTSFSRWLAQIFSSIQKYIPAIIVLILLAVAILSSMQPTKVSP